MFWYRVVLVPAVKSIYQWKNEAEGVPICFVSPTMTGIRLLTKPTYSFFRSNLESCSRKIDGTRSLMTCLGQACIQSGLSNTVL
jgi:hypothetical protein